VEEDSSRDSCSSVSGDLGAEQQKVLSFFESKAMRTSQGDACLWCDFYLYTNFLTNYCCESRLWSKRLMFVLCLVLQICAYPIHQMCFVICACDVLWYEDVWTIWCGTTTVQPVDIVTAVAGVFVTVVVLYCIVLYCIVLYCIVL